MVRGLPESEGRGEGGPAWGGGCGGASIAAVCRLRGRRRGPAAVVRGLPESEGRGEGGPGVCGPGEACGEGGEPEGALGVRTVILSPLGDLGKTVAALGG